MEVWGGNHAMDSTVHLTGLDVWVYCRPYHSAVAGGDVYYVSTCATGRISRLLVADVSGHGEAVSEMAVTLRHLMRGHVNHIDLEQFVRQMNDEFIAASEASIFATAVVTTYFAPTRTLSLCNAGHPPPLMYRAADDEWGFLHNEASRGTAINDVPLGIMSQVDYRPLVLDLAKGDLVICYTDSVMEICDARGQQLNLDGLLAVVRTLDRSDASTLIPRLLTAIECRCACNIEADDVTLLLFQPNLETGRTSIARNLLAPYHIVKSFLGSVRRRERRFAFPEFSVANLGGSIIPALSRWRRRKP